MSPWEENTWFEVPKITFLQVGIGADAQIFKADSRRVAFVLGANTNTGAVCDVAPSSKALVAGQGITMTTSFPLIAFTQHDFGPLVSMEWHALNRGAAISNLNVFEILLRDWPKEDKGGDDNARLADQIRRFAQRSKSPDPVSIGQAFRNLFRGSSG